MISQTTKHPLVAVVIPNRNGSDFLRRNMPFVAATDYPNWICVFTDNASTDDSVDFMREHFDFCHIIAAAADRGFAGNVNRGLRWGLAQHAKYIAVLSNDVTVPPAWLTGAVQVLEDNPKVGILGFTEVTDQDALTDPTGLEMENTIYPSGCAFLLRSRAVRLVGLYDESLYLYGEEQDYYPRLLRAGFTLAKCNVPVLHAYHGLTAASARNLWFRYRNAVYCALKNFGLAAGVVVLAKIFCYAVLPDSLLERLRAGSFSNLAKQATLSEGSSAVVDSSIALRTGRWVSRLGVFIAALAWNILYLPATFAARSHLKTRFRCENEQFCRLARSENAGIFGKYMEFE